MPESEQERLKRLRDQQIAARDPHIKTRQFQRETAVKARKYRRKLTLKDMWAVIPHMIRGIIYGMLAGLVALAVVPAIWKSSWALLCVGGGTLVAIVLGAVIGQAIDKRDEIRDLIK